MSSQGRTATLILFSAIILTTSSCVGVPQPAAQEQQLRATIAALETQVVLSQQPTPIRTIAVQQGEGQQLQATITALQTQIAQSTVAPTEVSTPTPTSASDTAPDAVLEVNQTWYQRGIELKIDKTWFDPSGIIVCTSVKNDTANQIVFKLGSYRTHMSAKDNRGADLQINTYNHRWGDWNTGWAFEEERTFILQPGESRPILDDNNCWIVYADIGNPQVTEIIIMLRDISRISEARWRIVVPH